MTLDRTLPEYAELFRDLSRSSQSMDEPDDLPRLPADRLELPFAIPRFIFLLRCYVQGARCGYERVRSGKLAPSETPQQAIDMPYGEFLEVIVSCANSTSFDGHEL